ncbi:hypothetical protein [Nonomuraea sp. JJY05]|uniref:hypothetical protein n=1 Tax=Nonomuraea sp. JJY05 TaxID=3350255 RepID=UPI00373F9369
MREPVAEPARMVEAYRMDPVIAEQLGRAHRSPAMPMTSSPTWPTPAPPPPPGAAREVPLVVVEHVRRCLELGGGTGQ